MCICIYHISKRVFECLLLIAMYASFATGSTSSTTHRSQVGLEGDRLIVEPIRNGRLPALLAPLDPMTEPFPDIDDDLPPLGDVLP